MVEAHVVGAEAEHALRQLQLMDLQAGSCAREQCEVHVRGPFIQQALHHSEGFAVVDVVHIVEHQQHLARMLDEQRLDRLEAWRWGSDVARRRSVIEHGVQALQKALGIAVGGGERQHDRRGFVLRDRGHPLRSKRTFSESSRGDDAQQTQIAPSRHCFEKSRARDASAGGQSR